jgi:signal peptidase I
MEYGGFWKELKQKLKWLDPFTYSDLLLQKLDPNHEWEMKRWVIELATAFISAFLLYTILGLILQTSMPLVIVVSGSMEPVLHRGDVALLQGVHSASDLKVQEATINQDIAGKGFWDFGSVNYFPDSTIPPSPYDCVLHRGKSVYSVLLNGKEYRLNTEGDIVVYFSQLPGRVSEPIIHRAVLLIHANDGDFLLTKGDSVYNPFFDADCGKLVGSVPECPCITLYPVPIQQLQGKAAGWIPLVGYVKLLLIDDLTQWLQGCPPVSNCPDGCCFP